MDILTTAPEVSRYLSSRMRHQRSIELCLFSAITSGPTIPPFSPILVARLLLCIFGIRTDKGIAKGRVITARFLQYGLSTNGHLIFAPPTTTYYTSVLCLRRLSSDSGGSNTLSWHPSGWLPPFLAFLFFMMK